MSIKKCIYLWYETKILFDHALFRYYNNFLLISCGKTLLWLYKLNLPTGLFVCFVFLIAANGM